MRLVAGVFGLVVIASGSQDAARGAHDEWRLTEWSACSNPCGLGTQTRESECVAVASQADGSEQVQRASDKTKCAALRSVPGDEPREQECFGESPPIPFCTSCHAGGGVRTDGACIECAAGFELTEDGVCTNSDEVVLLSIRADAARNAPQRTWRPRLTKCLESLAAEAGNVVAPFVGVYSIERLGADAADTFALRRLREKPVNSFRAPSNDDKILIYAGVGVAQGEKPTDLQKALEAKFDCKDILGSDPREWISLEKTAVLSGGHLKDDDVPFAQEVPWRLSPPAWAMLTSGTLLFAALVAVPAARIHRQREHRRRQFAPPIIAAWPTPARELQLAEI